jgi:hypothetical protein
MVVAETAGDGEDLGVREMLQKRWQGCVFLMLSFLLCTGPGMFQLIVEKPFSFDGIWFLAHFTFYVVH